MLDKTSIDTINYLLPTELEEDVEWPCLSSRLYVQPFVLPPHLGGLKSLHWHHNERDMASQITSLTTVYSTFYSGADQRKHQSSASLAFVWGIVWPVNSSHNRSVTWTIFPFDDVILCVSRLLLFVHVTHHSWALGQPCDCHQCTWNNHWRIWKMYYMNPLNYIITKTKQSASK